MGGSGPQTAKITNDWYAGYKMEVEDRVAASETVNQIDDDNAPQGNALFVRQSYMSVGNKNLGEVRLTYMPKDDVTKDTDVTDLEDTMTSDNHMNRGFFLRPKASIQRSATLYRPRRLRTGTRA